MSVLIVEQQNCNKLQKMSTADKNHKYLLFGILRNLSWIGTPFVVVTYERTSLSPGEGGGCVSGRGPV